MSAKDSHQSETQLLLNHTAQILKKVHLALQENTNLWTYVAVFITFCVIGLAANLLMACIVACSKQTRNLTYSKLFLHLCIVDFARLLSITIFNLYGLFKIDSLQLLIKHIYAHDLQNVFLIAEFLIIFYFALDWFVKRQYEAQYIKFERGATVVIVCVYMYIICTGISHLCIPSIAFESIFSITATSFYFVTVLSVLVLFAVDHIFGIGKPDKYGFAILICATALLICLPHYCCTAIIIAASRGHALIASETYVVAGIAALLPLLMSVVFFIICLKKGYVALVPSKPKTDSPNKNKMVWSKMKLLR